MQSSLYLRSQGLVSNHNSTLHEPRDWTKCTNVINFFFFFLQTVRTYTTRIFAVNGFAILWRSDVTYGGRGVSYYCYYTLGAPTYYWIPVLINEALDFLSTLHHPEELTVKSTNYKLLLRLASAILICQSLITGNEPIRCTIPYVCKPLPKIMTVTFI